MWAVVSAVQIIARHTIFCGLWLRCVTLPVVNMSRISAVLSDPIVALSRPLECVQRIRLGAPGRPLSALDPERGPLASPALG